MATLSTFTTRKNNEGEVQKVVISIPQGATTPQTGDIVSLVGILDGRQVVGCSTFDVTSGAAATFSLNVAGNAITLGGFSTTKQVAINLDLLKV